MRTSTLAPNTRVWVIYGGKRHKGIVLSSKETKGKLRYFVHIPKWDKPGRYFTIFREENEVTPSMRLLKNETPEQAGTPGAA